MDGDRDRADALAHRQRAPHQLPAAEQLIIAGRSARAGAADGLDPLRAELDAWAESDRTAVLWWRDDDAAAADDPVRRMLDLAGEAEACVCVAASPALATEGLAEAVRRTAGAAVAVQHGYAHVDHSPPDERGGWELGAHRPLETVWAEAADGRDRMRSLFGEAFAPVMAPPWNRIAPTVAAGLPALGFSALSAFEGMNCAPPGMPRLDGHSDPIAWSRGGIFRGPEKVARELAAALAARRRGEASGPVGYVTHVWAQDEGGWTLLRSLLALAATHPGGRWLRADELPGRDAAGDAA